MINKILTDAHSNSTEVTAVLATLIDWKDAFPNQCPKLGIDAFIQCGVRPSLIPLLISYFQDRTMVVKWHGKISKEKEVPGGGPQGGYFGILEYLSQSNSSANCVDKESRYKFVDDLTALEKLNLLTIGLASFNIKNQVPNDIHTSNLFIPSENLKSQEYLNKIQDWTCKQKMVLNEDKTKTMLFNFTKSKQCSVRLKLNDKVIETVKETKLLGTIITNNLKWDKNTKYLIKKAYSRMELLRKVSEFCKSTKDRLHIYKMYVRSVVEQSAVVWHSSLTKGNITTLERVQRVAVKIILEGKHSYKESLNILNIPTLKERREVLSARFANKCLKNERSRNMFKLNISKSKMQLRYRKKYNEVQSKTNRLFNSAVPYMLRNLNKQNEKEKFHKMNI